MPEHCVEKIDCSSYIVPVIFQGLFNRLADIGMGRKVHDCRGTELLERLVEAIAVKDVPSDQRAPSDSPIVTRNEIVVNDWSKAGSC